MSLSLWDGEGNRLGGNVEGNFIIKKNEVNDMIFALSLLIFFSMILIHIISFYFTHITSWIP